MKMILCIMASLFLFGCMTKNITTYIDINDSHNVTIRTTDSQQKPMEFMREFSGTIPAM